MRVLRNSYGQRFRISRKTDGTEYVERFLNHILIPKTSFCLFDKVPLDTKDFLYDWNGTTVRKKHFKGRKIARNSAPHILTHR
jgi:hypothetical protein